MKKTWQENFHKDLAQPISALVVFKNAVHSKRLAGMVEFKLTPGGSGKPSLRTACRIAWKQDRHLLENYAQKWGEKTTQSPGYDVIIVKC